jgi:hypothetical protein
MVSAAAAARRTVLEEPWDNVDIMIASLAVGVIAAPAHLRVGVACGHDVGMPLSGRYVWR